MLDTLPCPGSKGEPHVTNRRDLVRGSLAAAAFAGAGRFIVAPRPATARQGRYDNGIQILDASGEPWLSIAVSDGGSSVSSGGSTLVVALVAVRCDFHAAIDIDPNAIVLRDRHDFVHAPFDAVLDGVALASGETREGVIFYRLPPARQARLAYYAPAGRLADIFAWPESLVAVDLDGADAAGAASSAGGASGVDDSSSDESDDENSDDEVEETEEADE